MASQDATTEQGRVSPEELARELARRRNRRADRLFRFPDPLELGCKTAAVVREHLFSPHFNVRLDDWRLAKGVGCLLHAIDYYGLTVDELAWKVGAPIALAVAEVSEDVRLSRHRRTQELVSRIPSASFVPRTALVCELLLQREWLEQFSDRQLARLVPHPRDVFLWADRAWSLAVACLHHRDWMVGFEREMQSLRDWAYEMRRKWATAR